MDERIPLKTIVSKKGLQFELWEGKRLAVLIQLRGRQIGRRCLLNADSLDCGRNPGLSDIAFPEDPEISGKHCRFSWSLQDGKYMVEDLKSLNGTWVNGQQISDKLLEDGDKIFIGSTVLKFTYHDVVEAEFHQEMEKRLNIDDLTGLVVKRNFDMAFEDALDFAKLREKSLSVFMMDMDGLKRINDTLGHFMGSHCISRVGQLIKRHSDGRGLATRFGGDEFTAYLMDTNKTDALDWAEQLRLHIFEYTFEKNQVRAYPTLSIGVATYPEDGEKSDELIRKADEALYRAKAAGRNRVST